MQVNEKVLFFNNKQAIDKIEKRREWLPTMRRL